MTWAVCAMPGNEAFAERLAILLGVGFLPLEWRRFPDGESYVRFTMSPEGRDIAIVCTMRDPDPMFLTLHFVTRTARELGASRIGLIAPYLAYMRQDRSFRDGEAVSSKYFAALLSADFDWLLTVDPHLHRYVSLADIYTIPTTMVSSASALADWIRTEVTQPLIVGPDAESERWVTDVACRVGAPHVVLRKTRRGDRSVEIDTSMLTKWKDKVPVIVDDIISSARTMAITVQRLRAEGYMRPVCVGVHGLFAGDAYSVLRNAGAARIVTTNAVSHETNAIDLSALIAEHVRKDFHFSALYPQP